MAISKDRKKELVAQYVDLAERSNAMFLAEYRGMSVKQMEELRTKLREVDGSLFVAKNTLIRVALEQTGNPVPKEQLTGQTVIGFALGEAPAMAKALKEYAKGEELFNLRGGIISKSIMSASDAEALADLPSLDELRSQVLGLINAPLSKLVGIFNAPARDLVTVMNGGVNQIVNVINAYATKEEEAAAA